MKKIIILLILLSLLVACTGNNNDKKEGSSEQSSAILIPANDVADEKIIEFINNLDQEFVGQHYYYYAAGKTYELAEDTIDFKGKFIEPKIIKKYYQKNFPDVLFVKFKSNIKNIAFHSAEQKEFDFIINISDKNSWVLSDGTIDNIVVIERNIDFKPEYVLDQNYAVTVRVDEEKYNANPDLYNVSGASKEYLAFTHEYDITYPLNSKSVKKIDYIAINKKELIDDNLTYLNLKLSAELTSGLVIKNKMEIGYKFKFSEKINDERHEINKDSKDYEYWDLNMNTENKRWSLKK